MTGEQDLYVPDEDEETSSETGMETRTWEVRSMWIGTCYADNAPRWPLLEPARRRSPRMVRGALAPQSRAANLALPRPLLSTAVITKSGRAAGTRVDCH